MSFQTGLRQPTTIHGLGVLCGAAVAAAEHYFTGSATLASGAGAIAYAATHLFVDDATTDRAAQTLTEDVLDAVVKRHVGNRLPAIVNDAVVLGSRLGALALPMPPVAPPTLTPQPLAPDPLRTAKSTVAGALGSLVLVCLLGACAGQTPAQVACEVDAAITEEAVPLADVLGGADAAAKAQTIVTRSAPLHAAVAKACATVMPAPQSPPNAPAGP